MVESREQFRQFRRSLKERLPYVRRRNYLRLEQENSKLKQEISFVTAAASAEVFILKAPEITSYSELCFFVTYTNEKKLKPYVVHHIQCLLEQGIGVVLIVNFDSDDLSEFEVEPSLVDQLVGAFIRENTGFDFAAWSHALSLFYPSDMARVFFVNDSIVGPINKEEFFLIVKAARECITPVFALTDNPIPLKHFQTFFWMVSGQVFADQAFRRYMVGVVNMIDKQGVIDKYELGLTQHLNKIGFDYSVFLENTSNELNTNQTIFDWEGLLSRGFPYVKASLFFDESVKEQVGAKVNVSFAPK